jgi:hypothetical protein
MGRYQGPSGTATNDETKALKDAGGKPLDNPARNVWVTETALTTALNTSYFASSVSLFAIVMGIALLLVGIGFLLLTSGLLTGEALPLPRPRTVPSEASATPITH